MGLQCRKSSRQRRGYGKEKICSCDPVEDCVGLFSELAVASDNVKVASTHYGVLSLG